MPLTEFQPYVIGYCCKCGADAVYCGDWEGIHWEGSADGCLCCLDPNEAPEALRNLIDEDELDESWDCPIHGHQEGPDCPRC